MSRRAGRTLSPRVLLGEADGATEPCLQRVAAFRILHDSSAQIIDANALDPGPGPLQIAPLLAIELQEGAAILQYLRRRRDLAQQVRSTHMHAGRPADVQLPARVHRHNAEVL